MQNKKIKKLLIVSVIAVFLLIVIIKIISQNELYIRDDKIENEEIEHIALVYRNLNYRLDYIYIMDDDGSVYYENFIENASEYAAQGEELLLKVLAVYEDKEKISYQFDEFSDSFKNKLYEINYNWTLFKKGGVEMDGGEQTYYALVQIGESYELIKLKQSGNCGEFPWNSDYKDICDYIDDIRGEIRDERKKDNKK